MIHSCIKSRAPLNIKGRKFSCCLTFVFYRLQFCRGIPAAGDRLPICICTFNVSSGCIVPCEAALAIAPAMTSCTGF